MIRLYPEQLRAAQRRAACGISTIGQRSAAAAGKSGRYSSGGCVARLRRAPRFYSIPVPTGDRFSHFAAMSLFASRQTLVLQLPENGPNAAMNEQLATLSELLHDDLLLIVRGNKLTKAQENAARYTALADRSVQVSCQTPEQAQLPAGWPPERKHRICNWMTPRTNCCAIAMRAICWRWRRRWNGCRCFGLTVS